MATNKNPPNKVSKNNGKDQLKTDSPTNPNEEVNPKMSDGIVSKIISEKNAQIISKENGETNHTTEPESKKAKLVDYSQKIKSHLATAKELFMGKSKKQKKGTKIYFGKKFIGIIAIFLFYSLILMTQLKGTGSSSPIFNAFVNIVTLGDPYSMGVSLVFSFITLMFLFSNTKVKEFIFSDNKGWLKQLLLYIGVIVIQFFFWSWQINTGRNIMPFLLILAMFWLIFQGLRLFFGARTYSTKVETRLLSKYSGLRYIFTIIAPFFILGFLTVVVWSYRYGLVVLTLDLIPFWRPEAMTASIEIYGIIIHLILPFLYISLLILFVFMSLEFILTRRKATNIRAGTFDNFTFGLIIFFMFFYLLFQISLYLFLNERTTSALRSISGAATGTSYLFWVEFAVSMLFLFRAISKAGASFGWKLLFLNQDAMIMGFLATVMAQTTSRLATYNEIPNQSLGALTGFVSLDHLLIPILIILILGFTILVYYIKPQEVSMFMRIAKETVDQEDKTMDVVVKFLKREFIRRGQKFPVDEIEPQLEAITDLPRGVIHSLLRRITEKYMDIIMTIEQTETGQVKYIDLISITEKYEGSKEGHARAQKYLTERLVSTLQKEKKQIRLVDSDKKITDIKEREMFLDALGSGYRKKIKEVSSRQVETMTDSIKAQFEKDVDEETCEIIYELIKKEYIYRVSHPNEFDDDACAIRISDIAENVFEATKVSAGVLYPLMDKWAKCNWNIQFLDEWVDYGPKNIPKLTVAGDHFIDFNPISDMDISEAVQKYRPKRLTLVRKVLFAWLIDGLSQEKKYLENKIIITSKPEIVPNIKEYDVLKPENFHYDIYYYKLMNYFIDHYKDKMNLVIWKKDMYNLRKWIDLIRESKEKSRLIHEKEINKSESEMIKKSDVKDIQKNNQLISSTSPDSSKSLISSDSSNTSPSSPSSSSLSSLSSSIKQPTQQTIPQNKPQQNVKTSEKPSEPSKESKSKDSNMKKL